MLPSAASLLPLCGHSTRKPDTLQVVRKGPGQSQEDHKPSCKEGSQDGTEGPENSRDGNLEPTAPQSRPEAARKNHCILLGLPMTAFCRGHLSFLALMCLLQMPYCKEH